MWLDKRWPPQHWRRISKTLPGKSCLQVLIIFAGLLHRELTLQRHGRIQICAGQIGCAYNMPSHTYERSNFTECEGDLQMDPGLYILDGQSTLIVFMCSPCPTEALTRLWPGLQPQLLYPQPAPQIANDKTAQMAQYKKTAQTADKKNSPIGQHTMDINLANVVR